MKILKTLAWLTVLGCAMNGGAQTNSPLSSLQIFRAGYPRAFFFRQAESVAVARKPDFTAWNRDFSQLMGIMGKALDEEVPGRGRNVDFFNRFKQAHPDQALLLHMNGNARDPRFEGERFFAGHWLYFNGAKILENVPAKSGETVIRVSDVTLFEVNGGRYKNSNDDIGLCVFGADGKPDWTQSEQVQLISIDRKKGTIRVRRGAYGTTPRAFAAGQAYAAAHCVEGPWGKDSHLLWLYNYSTKCPRDAKGRTCSDVAVAHLAELFNAGGKLANFDGLEFDVLFNEAHGGNKRRRGADCDADGRRDDGVIEGVNVYGSGVVEFCRQLRGALGENKLIMADGSFKNDDEQRAFGLLNGMESEGWPHLLDFNVTDWSGGLNRQRFWQANGRAPVLSYINHKFNDPTAGGAVDEKRAKVGFNIHRLVFAAAVLTDSAITFSMVPEVKSRIPLVPNLKRSSTPVVWDEFVAGTRRQTGWLGQPVGPAIHLATRGPDLLRGSSRLRSYDLVGSMESPDATVKMDRGAIRVSAKDAKAPRFGVRLKGLACDGADLYFTVTARGEPMKNHPPEMARLVRASLVPGDPLSPPVSSEHFMSWINVKEFASTFYFSDVRTRTADLELVFESAEPVWISSINAHAAPDAMVREFEHGLVVANPSPRSQTLDLAKNFPGKHFRRFTATPGQDSKINNGQSVGASLTIAPKDALFLLKD